MTNAIDLNDVGLTSDPIKRTVESDNSAKLRKPGSFTQALNGADNNLSGDFRKLQKENPGKSPMELLNLLSDKLTSAILDRSIGKDASGKSLQQRLAQLSPEQRTDISSIVSSRIGNHVEALASGKFQKNIHDLPKDENGKILTGSNVAQNIKNNLNASVATANGSEAKKDEPKSASSNVVVNSTEAAKPTPSVATANGSEAKKEEPKTASSNTVVNSTEADKPTQTVKTVSFASASYDKNTLLISYSINTPDVLIKHDSSKNVMEDLKKTVEAAISKSEVSRKAFGESIESYKSTVKARQELVTVRNAFDEDLTHASTSTDLNKWKKLLKEENVNFLTQLEKDELDKATSMSDLIAKGNKILKGRDEEIIKYGELKKDESFGPGKIKDAEKLMYDKQAELENAVKTCVGDIDKANSDALEALKNLNDAYVNDTLRAMKNDSAIVPFKNEQLRQDSSNVTDTLKLFENAITDPTLKAAFEEKRMLTKDELDKLPADQKELAKLLGNLANKNEKGEPLLDQDLSTIENAFIGFDGLSDKDRPHFKTMKLFHANTMKAFDGFVRYGFTDIDGNPTRDPKLLAERWGLEPEVAKDAIRSLFGTIHEERYRGFTGIESGVNDPKMMSQLAADANRLISDRTDRVSEVHQKVINAMNIFKLQTKDWATFIVSLGLNAKPVEAFLGAAAGRDDSGILGLAALGIAFNNRFNRKSSSNTGNGNTGGNGNNGVTDGNGSVQD